MKTNPVFAVLLSLFMGLSACGGGSNDPLNPGGNNNGNSGGSTQMDTTPEVSFTSKTEVPLDTDISSEEKTPVGYTDWTPISVTGGCYSINGAPCTNQNGTLRPGNKLLLQVHSATEPNTAKTVTVTMSGVSASFTATTGSGDSTPDAFGFTPKTDVPLDSLVTSDEIVLSGFDSALVRVLNGTYSLNGGDFTDEIGTAEGGDRLRLQVRSATTAKTPKSVSIAVGQLTGSFTATTAPETTAPSLTLTTIRNGTLDDIVQPGAKYRPSRVKLTADNNAHLTDFTNAKVSNDMDGNLVIGPTNKSIPKPEGGGDIPTGYPENADTFITTPGDKYEVRIHVYADQGYNQEIGQVDSTGAIGKMENGVSTIPLTNALAAVSGNTAFLEIEVVCPKTPSANVESMPVIGGNSSAGTTTNGTVIVNHTTPPKLVTCSK